MADYSLKAVTNPLFLTDAVSTTTTDVNYSALYPIFLWKRVNGIQWVREDLNDPIKGTRTSNSLRAGGFVEYGMLLEPYVDPNASWFEQKSFVAHFDHRLSA